jgi:hypothetical protein
MKTTSIILLIPTLGVFMMAMYGLSITAFAVTVFGITVAILNNKFYK